MMFMTTCKELMIEDQSESVPRHYGWRYLVLVLCFFHLVPPFVLVTFLILIWFGFLCCILFFVFFFGSFLFHFCFGVFFPLFHFFAFVFWVVDLFVRLTVVLPVFPFPCFVVCCFLVFLFFVFVLFHVLLGCFFHFSFVWSFVFFPLIFIFVFWF